MYNYLYEWHSLHTKKSLSYKCSEFFYDRKCLAFNAGLQMIQTLANTNSRFIIIFYLKTEQVRTNFKRKLYIKALKGHLNWQVSEVVFFCLFYADYTIAVFFDWSEHTISHASRFSGSSFSLFHLILHLINQVNWMRRSCFLFFINELDDPTNQSKAKWILGAKFFLFYITLFFFYFHVYLSLMIRVY